MKTDPARERAILEDLAFLDSCHVGATEAVRRVGIPSVAALEKFLTRRNRYDLLNRLMHRDPIILVDYGKGRPKPARQRLDVAS